MTILLHLKSVVFRANNRALYSFLQSRQQFTQRGMKAYIQVLGQNSAEGPPSLLIHYDSQRYLFNCREGTQRLCVQEKARLAKLTNVFLTRVNWECMGGLTGKNYWFFFYRSRSRSDFFMFRHVAYTY